jgi:hypothetical protein
MATIAQIEANRKNAQKSTGPTSDSGKEAVRFNALKSGIDAASIIIPGEDPDQFSKLAEGFTDSWQPANAAESELVDHLIEDSWRLRRLRTAETQLWTRSIEGRRTGRRHDPRTEVGDSYDGRCDTFSRLQRQMASIKRTNHQTTLDLQRLQSARKATEAAELAEAAQAAAALAVAQAVPPEPLPECPRPQTPVTEQSQFLPADPAPVPPQPKRDSAYWRKFVAENCSPSAKVPL